MSAEWLREFELLQRMFKPEWTLESEVTQAALAILDGWRKMKCGMDKGVMLGAMIGKRRRGSMNVFLSYNHIT